MNPANREMDVEAGWDMSCSPASVIQCGGYAILKGREVVLIIYEDEETLQGISLTNEQGLHYDGDVTLGKYHTQKMLESGQWGITESWVECETYLETT